MQQFISLDITSLLIKNIEDILIKLKNEKYASREAFPYLFNIIENILIASKSKINEIRKELNEAKILREKQEIIQKNYDLNNALNYIIPILHDLSFSNIDFIDFDDYAIIEYISEQISLNKDFKDKIIICLITASLPKMNFEMSNFLFNSAIKQYFSKLNVKFPEISLHIRYPLLLKNNFLLKTSFFHEYSHLIDISLKISKEYNINISEYQKEIDEIIKKYIIRKEFQMLPKQFIIYNIKANLNKILNNWIKELVADIISTLIIGPAIRSLLIFWNLKDGIYNYNETHPPFYLRIKFISELLKKYNYIDLENEKKALKIIKQLNNEPSEDIYKLAIKIIENEMNSLFNACLNKVPSLISTIKKVIAFLKEENPEKNLLLDLTRNKIPLGAYLPLCESNNKDIFINFKETSIYKILNIYWEYFFENLFDAKKELDKKLQIFRLIEERSKKSIDILRGFQLYQKFIGED
ncbi:MAG: hypothetical protein ACTSQP_08235 [Promethearchaeota archaeon]